MEVCRPLLQTSLAALDTMLLQGRSAPVVVGHRHRRGGAVAPFRPAKPAARDAKATRVASAEGRRGGAEGGLNLAACHPSSSATVQLDQWHSEASRH